jgi:hypothetical protein
MQMSSGTDSPAYGRFSGFLVQRSQRRADSHWSHSTKVLLWVGLAIASWAAVIAAAYFIWSAL